MKTKLLTRDFQNAGFSLVELSIVLVILGLLTGGILAGQSLIRAAELRAVSTEYNRYITAVGTFRDKYFALPGDMNNAASFWNPADGSTGLTAGCATATAAGTCNGNGDGIILPSTASNESYRFWQHLASAGLIEGSYSGVPAGAAASATSNATNSPAGKLRPGYWFVWNWGTVSAQTYIFDGAYDNWMEYGGLTAGDPNSPIMKPEEVWNLDTKIDDGKPATGRVVVRGAFANCTDASASTTLTANYLLSSGNILCMPIFRRIF